MTKEQILNHYDPIPYDGCWLWRGATRNGYGTVRYNGKSQSAHRVVYEITKAPIPEGMFVCHTCDVRDCVNPDHFFLGDGKANMADCVAKGRIAAGERQGHSKLTEAQVLEMRRKRASGMSYDEIAKGYDVIRNTVKRICNRERWGWLK